MSLFLDKAYKLTFEKIAMPVRLSESPENWQREIAGEIYKQLPFIGDYSVNVILDRVDNQRGFGFGSAFVTNKTDTPSKENLEHESLRIPIIIRQYVMAPLDVFMDSTGVYPLTEGRIREKLFSSSTFSVSDRKPPDKGMMDQLYPPFRSNFGAGGGGDMGLGKFANAAEQARRQAVARMKAEASANPEHIGVEKGASLLSAIAPTITQTDADQFVDNLSKDPALSHAVAHNDALSKMAMKIATGNMISVEKTASALINSIKPTVVQLQKLSSGNFKVKWANAGAFLPQEDIIPPSEASAMAGRDLAGMTEGTITVSTEKAQKKSLIEDTFKPVKGYGTYTVQDVDTGHKIEGTVYPIVDLDMHPLQLFLFASPQGYSVQDELIGIKKDSVSRQQPLPITQAHGTGAFSFPSDGGQAVIEPVTIKANGQTPEGIQLQCETMFGDMVSLLIAPGIQNIEMMGAGVYAIPSFLEWIPLPEQAIHLVKTQEELGAVNEVKNAPSTVGVGSTGQGEFSLDGPPIAKIAKDQRHFIKTAQAEFLLVAMGISPFEAKEILKTAEKGKFVKVACNTLTPLSDVHQDMVKKASKSLTDFPFHLKINLVKEAAAIEDEDTMDKILSMGFINPENIEIFSKYLPDLEQTAKKLAEMLLAIRLGLGSVDEGAVERAMKGLDHVINGLNLLQQKVSA